MPTQTGDRPLKDSLQRLAAAVGERAVAKVGDSVTGATRRLTDYAEGNSGGLVSAITGTTGDKAASGLGGLVAGVAGKAAGGLGKLALAGVKDKVAGLVGGIGDALGLGGGQPAVINVVEDIDVGVPVRVAYDQWTRFTEFPDFLKKVEDVEQESDERLAWTAKVLWSRRTWKATIVDQVPDERIVWRSEGDKGHVDGAVTFHELTPDLTRILLVLEYHPRGLFERTGNLWRAQGRRARLELKHFRRHVMTKTILAADELEGWRGEIHDEAVSHPGTSPTENERTGA